MLFALGFTPRVDAPHGGRATAGMIGALGRQHDVAVLYLRDAALPPADETVVDASTVVEAVDDPPPRTTAAALRRRARLASGLARGRPMMVAHTYVERFGHELGALAERFDADVIHFEPEEMAQYMRAVPRKHARRVVVVHEPGTAAAEERWRSFSPLKRLARRLDVLAWRRFERLVASNADLVVALTERDERALRAIAQAPVARVPLAIPIPERPLDPVGADPPAVLFVGGYTHPPNEDAALRLLRSIWPRVRDAVPTATLELVGSRPTEAMSAAAGDGVAVRGRVPELTPLLEAAAVVVLPIRLGGGMRVKAMEALASGKAVVASQRALEGLDVVDGREVLVAETDAEFIQATVRLLDDDGLRRRLGAAARAWAEAHVSVEAAASAYSRLYSSVVEGSRAGQAARP